MVEEYYARTSDHGYETCVEHLSMVGALAGGFAGRFGQLDEGLLAGVFHDAGKYSEAFQKRIRNPEHTAKVDHSTAGAVEMAKHNHFFAALAIAGHHAGIPELGTGEDTEQDASFVGRQKRAADPRRHVDCSPMREQFNVAALESLNALPERMEPYSTMMRIRMIFSALVDGDRLDAEFFTKDNSSRAEHDLLRKTKTALNPERLSEQQSPTLGQLVESAEQVKRTTHDDAYMALEAMTGKAERRAQAFFDKQEKTPLDEKRCQILCQCLEKGKDRAFKPGLYTLTAPTGGGKTNASITFALEHAKAQNLERIIYVIPYTSIIDQTVSAFEQEFGVDMVLPHYSEAPYNLAEQHELDEKNLKRSLASENWNAPIIVTTAVQFFESLYSNKTSRCRKLHNIANSVIVFDEAQTLPPQHLKPCIRAILELVDRYGCSAMLCTATQPELLPVVRELKHDKTLEIPEITEMTDDEVMQFERTTIEFTGNMTLDELAQKLYGLDQALCVVNTRKEAQELYRKIGSLRGNDDGLFCLTTLHCAADRKLKFEEIRKRLRNGQPCSVISTSLIEAGVDVDFPVAFREEAGLDSILQTAGRCNREGMRSKEESIVTVFSTDEGKVPFLQQNLSALEHVKESHFDDVNEPAAIHCYFSALLNLRGGGQTTGEHDPLDASSILKMHRYGYKGRMMPFGVIDQNFHLIDDLTTPVYVQINDESRDLCSQLLNGECNRTLFRKLGKYVVNVWPQHLEALLDAGKLSIIGEEGEASYILTDSTAYALDLGLSIEDLAATGLFS
ncbi:CRISPR-associated helicase Cas3' [uncultured Bifidobacterium sp.]|uniref:CRISPR-associated helicase Cas3' n=1 Tax=uncultured Bifidobacterium sp. TaxID=165187 RepID=UPI0025994ABA|nr:CRISPR-associated helicase Cas3' [uncultured Bifidobacterium sp.]